MHRGHRLVPVGLIVIEGILANLPVDGHQALVVLVGGVSLEAAGGAEIEHVPDIGAPDPVALRDYRPLDAVDIGLAFHRMLLAHRVVHGEFLFLILPHMHLGAGAGAVFADSHGCGGMLGVPAVQEGPKVVLFAVIPAVVLVERHHVRDELVGGVYIHGAGGEPPRVHLVGHLVEPGHDLVCPGLNLIVQAPEADAGVVEVLGDHFPKLELQVVVEGRIGHPGAHEGDFLPHHIAAAVRLLKHEVRLRVMGQAEGIHAHLVKEIVVREVVLLGKGRCQAVPVLMPGYALQLQVLPVQEEALLPVYVVIPEADGFLHPVHFHPVFQERNHGGIQVRVCLAVPQMRTVHSQVAAHHVVEDAVVIGIGHHLSGGVLYSDAHLAALIVREGGQVDFRAQVCPFAAGLLGDEHTVRAEVERGDAHRLRHFQPGVAVQAAVDVEVAAERRHVKGGGVAADHRQGVFAGLYKVCNFESEGVVGALVLPDEGGIHLYGGHAPGPFEANEDALAGIGLRDVQGAGISAEAPVIGAFRLEIAGIVAVREGDGIPLRAASERGAGHRARFHEAFDKGPSVVEGFHFPGLEGKGGHQQGQGGTEISFHCG